jgi:hypothetical protein
VILAVKISSGKAKILELRIDIGLDEWMNSDSPKGGSKGCFKMRKV